MNRKTIGVIAAEANNIEQRQILSGIIEEAKKHNINVAVLSNIYNPVKPDPAIRKENNIFDGILSEDFAGLILISESIINPELQQKIQENLQQKKNIPIVVIGAFIDSFSTYQFVNTNDEKDIELLTDHLIDEHHFSNIHILTGLHYLEASHLRVNGYRKSLEKHHLSFSEDNVFYGDFWMNSGIDLANQYISGSITLPQAIVCANDYMAYGILDTFLENGVRVPEDVTVVGYEYIPERFIHFPILTTYQRNRKALGEKAIRCLLQNIGISATQTETDLTGSLIHGNSCSCGIQLEQYSKELKKNRISKKYYQYNLASQMEHRLTECKNIQEFLTVCQKFLYLIRNVSEVFLCLSENWYDSNIAPSNTVICYSLADCQQKMIIEQFHFSALFSLSKEPCTYYILTLFYASRSFGYIVLKYCDTDCYDSIFRNWIKTVSNGLEFLRIKNDIQYLTQCQNLSQYRDSLTGLWNKNGMKKEIIHFFQTYPDKSSYYIAVQICLFHDNYSLHNIPDKITAQQEIAQAILQFCTNQKLCAKIKDDFFLCMIPCNQNTDFYIRRMYAICLQHFSYLSSYGVDSLICYAMKAIPNMTLDAVIEQCQNELHILQDGISQHKKYPYYAEMQNIRNNIYLHPEQEHTIEKIATLHSFSSGHFRSLYKKCFDISFHQDCIQSRIFRAIYLLCTTDLGISHISEKCGYNDEKYFIRQFTKVTGLTPNQYRTII